MLQTAQTSGVSHDSPRSAFDCKDYVWRLRCRRALRAWGALAGREDRPATRQNRRQGHAAGCRHRDRARRWLGAAQRSGETLPGWLAEIAAVSPSMDRRVPGPVEPARSAVATTSPPANAEPTTRPAALVALPSTQQSPASSKAAATPGAAAASPAPPLTTAALPPAATGSDEPPASPLPPPTADPADPYQMRAAAVGLHPDLSRVLLARLSPTDYRNAGIAIQTAVAETPDSAVFVWPRQRKPELALFQVRFVSGAAPGCRRYVRD